ncbi:MAG: GNAT family N-acetyltransferase [Bacilli bacterium]|jgi:L-amino acid N-acyltransferase YncA|nr:GNAT family N-acetyltransferase [Bacilli bacterium]
MKIRPYQTKDLKNVTDICEETAFDSYKKDPVKLKTVPINFLDYFIEQEKEHVLVAVDEKDEAIGYIEATTSYPKFVQAMEQIYLPRLQQIDPSEIEFEKRFLLALSCIEDWPSHLHINLNGSYQHQGIGTKLIQALIDLLKKEGFHSLAICCCQQGSNSYGFYKHFGFKEIFDYGKGIVSLGIKF